LHKANLKKLILSMNLAFVSPYYCNILVIHHSRSLSKKNWKLNIIVIVNILPSVCDYCRSRM